MDHRAALTKLFVIAVSTEALIMAALHPFDLGPFTKGAVDTLLLGAVLGSYLFVTLRRESARREKAEQDSEAAESRFRALVEQSLVGIAIVQDGRLAYANPRLSEMFGYPRDEVLSKGVLDLVVEEDRPLVAEQIRLRLSGKAPTVHYEFRGLRKDGSTIHVELFGSATWHDGRPAVIGSLLDISGRVHAEREKDRSADIQAALNSLLATSLSTANLAGTLERCLGLLLSIPWLSVESRGAIFLAEEDGKSLRMVAQKGLSEAVLSRCAKVPVGECLCGLAARTGLLVHRAELDEGHSVSYGDIAPHGHYCVPIKLRGKVLGVVNLYLAPGHANDPKEASFLEAASQVLASIIEHQQLDASLQQSQKMEAVGQLSGGVAHDFNNLLTSILGCSEFLIDALPAEDARREDALEIKKTAERAADLTRQLLAFSRRQTLMPKDIDLNALVADSLKLLRRLIGENIDIRSDRGEGRLVAHADQGQILQVLMNLAVNARDAMPGGGKLTITTGSLAGEEASALAAASLPARQVYLSVSDTGVGMDEDTRSRIFEPFFTTKERGKGTGLGLAVVFGIVKQSGGMIHLRTAPGKGSTFTVLLPAVEESVQAQAREQPPAPPLRGTETVLLVEDEAPVRLVVSRMLRESGYEVLAAAGAEQALAIARDHPGPIHLLLTDVVMPGMAGPTLARLFAPLRPAAQVMFMTGYVDGSLSEDPIFARGATLLRKPLAREALLQALQRRFQASG
ncbi:MAG: PAS domain S-box protein [Elusimicrobia bacterium]|nr:PAS domain S-box protein [Elusimicrobiota bacterium]